MHGSKEINIYNYVCFQLYLLAQEHNSKVKKAIIFLYNIFFFFFSVYLDYVCCCNIDFSNLLLVFVFVMEKGISAMTYKFHYIPLKCLYSTFYISITSKVYFIYILFGLLHIRIIFTSPAFAMVISAKT